VTCQGQVIGAILADTKSQAQRAAKTVKVTYEELEPIITLPVNSVDFILADHTAACSMLVYCYHSTHVVYLTVCTPVCNCNVVYCGAQFESHTIVFLGGDFLFLLRP